MELVRNMCLLIRLLILWRHATLVMGTILVFLGVVDVSQRYELTVIETGVAVLGFVTGYAFLKASWLLTFYDLVFKSKFSGSYFIMAALVSILFLVSLGCAVYIGNSRVSNIPFEVMPWLLVFSYVFITPALALIFKLAHWLFREHSPPR